MFEAAPLVVGPDDAPTRAELEALPRRPLRRGADYAPDVYTCRWRAERIVVKDFRAKPWFWRHALGRLLIRREAAALARLRGLPGVPRLLGRPDVFSLAMSELAGVSLGAPAGAAQADAGFVAALRALLDEIHRRGVVHLDLRHRGNILVGPDGGPRIVDFTSAVALAPDREPGRTLAALLARVDDLAFLKWKARVAPAALTRRERRRAAAIRRLRRVWLPRLLLDAFFDVFRRKTIHNCHRGAND